MKKNDKDFTLKFSPCRFIAYDVKMKIGGPIFVNKYRGSWNVYWKIMIRGGTQDGKDYRPRRPTING